MSRGPESDPGPSPGNDPLPNIDGFDQENILELLRNPSGIEDLLLKTTETGDSPAEVCADLINTMRADTVRLAAALGIDMEVERITPEITAEALAKTVSGDVGMLLEIFAQEEDRRARLLAEVLEGEEFRRFERKKRAAMFSTPAPVDDMETDSDPEREG